MANTTKTNYLTLLDGEGHSYEWFVTDKDVSKVKETLPPPDTIDGMGIDEYLDLMED